jgi:hypothetical protein
MVGMNCPFCGFELFSGVVRFRRPLWSHFVSWGSTALHATFVGKDGERKDLLAQWQKRPAVACGKCYRVFVLSQHRPAN